MGASRAGYASDMTRTMLVGRRSAKIKDTYEAVLDAQLAAIASVRDGVTADSVDRAARRVLRARGLDKAFVHATGHGLGLDPRASEDRQRRDHHPSGRDGHHN